VRLLTLTGPGGTGKTRLSLEVAQRLADAFEGAVWFAPLADLSDPHSIPDAVLDALRLPRSPQRAPLDQVVEHLAKQPAALLVLDNFEHLVEAAERRPCRRCSRACRRSPCSSPRGNCWG
jgi:predicted ATPase